MKQHYRLTGLKEMLHNSNSKKSFEQNFEVIHAFLLYTVEFFRRKYLNFEILHSMIDNCKPH